MARFSMLDIAVVRRDPDRVRRSARRRGLDPSFVDDVLRYDAEYRSALSAAETSKAEKNRISAEIGTRTRQSRRRARLRPAIDTLDATIAHERGTRARALTRAEDSPLRALLEQTPNLLDDSVPDGADERANVVVRAWGEPRHFDFAPKPHWEIGETLGIDRFRTRRQTLGQPLCGACEAPARGSRERSHSFSSIARRDAGYDEIAPPFLVSRATMWSTGPAQQIRRCDVPRSAMPTCS